MVSASRQVSEANGFLPSSVSRTEVEVHAHNPVTGLRQRGCLAAGGEEGVETCRADGERSPVGPPMKNTPGSLSVAFLQGFW